MKSAVLPPLRVAPEIRKQAEAVLSSSETLSSFMTEAVQRHIQHRHAENEFLARGLASAAPAELSGKYVSANTVLQKLETKLAKAKLLHIS